ncbi:MAG: hypothetical protein AB1443_02100 [Pseudomonadota bacterium]
MSGPMAASFGLEAAVLVSAQSIIQGAAEVATGLAAADRIAAKTRQQRKEERQRMRAAEQAGSEQQQRMAATRAAQVRFAALFAASQTDTAAQAALARRLEELGSAGASLQQQMAAFLEQAGQAAATDIATARRVLVARVLERLELAPDAALPPALEALAQQVIAAPSAERAEALVTELRLQVKHHNEARADAAAQQQLQEAAAIVLEQSLKDLGYAVEEIEETLFVEGGVAHFQKPGWGDYFIRLRIDPKRNAMNFNVVRAGTTGEDRAREDMLAEERWCAEFPKLFETLKARGIPITVTRLLQAGEAPVQVVDAASLPARATEEHHHEPLKARSIE